MCLAYIITWRSKKGIGETCKIQLELFEFYRYLEVVVGTCSASNLFQAILKVHAFKPPPFFNLTISIYSGTQPRSEFFLPTMERATLRHIVPSNSLCFVYICSTLQLYNYF